MVRRWRSWFLEGWQNVHDDERSGRPVTATDNAAVRNVVEADRRITIYEIMIRLPPGIKIRRSSIRTIMSDVLNFHKVCARWVPRLLSENHKQQWMEAARAFLEMHRRDREQLFSCIVTGDESWVHHSTPETKRQNMVWKKPEESAPKKAKVTISAGKVMAIIFWDCKSVLLVDYLPPNTTINAARYCEVINKLRAAIKRKRPGLLSRKVLLLLDNARPHAARTIQTLLENFKWEIFTHPPYSPDLSPSDFHLFPALKLHLGGKHFANDDEVQAEANHWLRRQDTAWYNSGIKKLIQRYQKCLDRNDPRKPNVQRLTYFRHIKRANGLEKKLMSGKFEGRVVCGTTKGTADVDGTISSVSIEVLEVEGTVSIVLRVGTIAKKHFTCSELLGCWPRCGWPESSGSGWGRAGVRGPAACVLRGRTAAPPQHGCPAGYSVDAPMSGRLPSPPWLQRPNPACCTTPVPAPVALGHAASSTTTLIDLILYVWGKQDGRYLECGAGGEWLVWFIVTHHEVALVGVPHLRSPGVVDGHESQCEGTDARVDIRGLSIHQELDAQSGSGLQQQTVSFHPRQMLMLGKLKEERKTCNELARWVQEIDKTTGRSLDELQTGHQLLYQYINQVERRPTYQQVGRYNTGDLQLHHGLLAAQFCRELQTFQDLGTVLEGPYPLFLQLFDTGPELCRLLSPHKLAVEGGLDDSSECLLPQDLGAGLHQLHHTDIDVTHEVGRAEEPAAADDGEVQQLSCGDRPVVEAQDVGGLLPELQQLETAGLETGAVRWSVDPGFTAVAADQPAEGISAPAERDLHPLEAGELELGREVEEAEASDGDRPRHDIGGKPRRVVLSPDEPRQSGLQLGDGRG
ncbi:hypothetical protein LAZ67_1004162 [Cordylochernes scorpioides]|uniref:Transposase n=1 Tax=Cordylochernes scorpioides TaxID=51811 RepID=A0ABY6JXG1_9ARAC|nr:hypothetical protein LAZ67_1004162 [Cordylochernes scorpioides]